MNRVFFQARRPARVNAAILALAVVALLLGEVRLPSDYRDVADNYVPVLALLVMPVALVSLLDVAAVSPMPTVERQASRSLAPLRFGWVLLLTLIAAALLMPAAALSPVSDAALITLTNLAGCLAVTLLADQVLGAGRGWFLGVPYGLLGLTVTPADAHLPDWTILVRPEASPGSFTVALLLMTAALVIHAIRPRWPSRDGEDQS